MTAFVIARQLATAGERSLEGAVTASQGVAGTALVVVDGPVGPVVRRAEALRSVATGGRWPSLVTVFGGDNDCEHRDWPHPVTYVVGDLDAVA